MPKRLKYDKSHWTREGDVEKGLEQYLELAGRAFNRTKSELFRRLAGDVNGKRILDYGGGAGIMSVPMAEDGARVVMVDAEANALRTARYYAEKRLVADNIRIIHSERLPESLKKERFDMIIAKDVIEHIEDDQKFLKGLACCQKKGGIMLLSTQNKISLNYLLEGSYQKYWCRNLNWFGWDQTHLRFYTPSLLKERLRNAGYSPVKWAGVYIIPYDILSWASLLKFKFRLDSLHHFDLLFGSRFPFNRLGWSIIVRAEKTA